MCWTLQGRVNVLEDGEGISLDQIHKNLSPSHYVVKLSKTNNDRSVMTRIYYNKYESHGVFLSIFYWFFFKVIWHAILKNDVSLWRINISPMIETPVNFLFDIFNKLFITLINNSQFWFIINSAIRKSIKSGTVFPKLEIIHGKTTYRLHIENWNLH